MADIPFDLMSNLRQIGKRLPLEAVAIPLGFLLLLGMLLLPVPPFLLDLFFTFNIALSLVILFLAIAAARPFSFSVFPTVLLFATLLRLALNVASTRVVLSQGHEGTDAAGHVIEAFGSVLVAGDYIVGIVVFAILVIINFVVVTKGAGRVSEVTARFTLDALPGKQMAVDADLAAGLITQDQARARRREISSEADFYGSMDGASKFVRGDAIAGILILLINIVGGILVGSLKHGLTMGDAVERYTTLAVGDGLVAQVPSLLLSVATAIIVTRVSGEESLHQQTSSQFNNIEAWWLTACILALLGVIPGMPHLAFLSLAAVTAGAAWMLSRRRAQAQMAERTSEAAPAAPKELSWSDVQQADAIGLEVGYALVSLIDSQQGGALVTRIRGIRKKLTYELGFLIPQVHIRDNLDLRPEAYQIMVNGVVIGRGEVKPTRELAIHSGVVHGELQGLRTKDPTFGLDAVWIDPAQRDYARSLGYTVVDASTTIATHLNKILQENCNLLLGHDETQQLVDKLAAGAPKLVEELIPKKLPIGTLTQVLQNLLAEGVSIRDLRGVLLALAPIAEKVQDIDELTGVARVALGRMIVQQFAQHGEELSVMTLAPELEQVLHATARRGQGGNIPVEPELAEGLLRSVSKASQDELNSDRPALLVTSPTLRPWLSRILRPRIPGLSVLSYSELPEDTNLRVNTSITVQARQTAAA
ncbi:MAG: flagellar biosynthesis protein FlhA [Actinobacteria bacterium]|nr:flagellar biosynthesis protein FlhA [Actinomycetota bacterium]NBR66732.1 flagellar biosynthesis protein FlhA [Actinomycetota bacterium]